MPQPPSRGLIHRTVQNVKELIIFRNLGEMPIHHSNVMKKYKGSSYITEIQYYDGC